MMDEIFFGKKKLLLRIFSWPFCGAEVLRALSASWSEALRIEAIAAICWDIPKWKNSIEGWKQIWNLRCFMDVDEFIYSTYIIIYIHVYGCAYLKIRRLSFKWPKFVKATTSLSMFWAYCFQLESLPKSANHNEWIQQIWWTQHDPCTKKHGHNVICLHILAWTDRFYTGPGLPFWRVRRVDNS